MKLRKMTYNRCMKKLFIHVDIKKKKIQISLNEN